MTTPRSPGGTLALAATLLGLGLSATSAHAALPLGAKAPDFTAQATLGGHEFRFSLADALRHGPVVVYFYPAAFTEGCTIEAHDFAAAIPDYKAAGATVIGVSEDGIAKLDKFSVSECQGKFPVAADADGSIARRYDALLPIVHFASRTSYVIAPDGSVLESYNAMNPDGHVQKTLAAVQAWQARRKS
ncbi:peroxiredoxin [Lichenicoccus roseus]|uniref:thioredoxin-dependent peroxiredoxin n=1 Tax=Lichenicoccus roseus TaxID=2683649 RepID=A0A5R9J9F6_9PROT|nr:peroxiredoxin [Lichenicoccus roseus]